MIWAAVPETCGKVRSSCSMPSCASVPGMVIELSKPLLRPSAAPPITNRMRSQEPSTRQGCWNDHRPSEESRVDTKRSSGKFDTDVYPIQKCIVGRMDMTESQKAPRGRSREATRAKLLDAA